MLRNLEWGNMRTNEIEKQLRQRPFVPFRLCMTDGASLEVRHPEMILISRTILAVATFNARAQKPETIVFCDPVHIIRLEPFPDGKTRVRRRSKR